MNSDGSVFFVGDNAANRQYRAILSFDTAALPDNATVASVTLKIRKAGLVGTNPFKTLGNIVVDVRKGVFSDSAALQAGDFQAAANRGAAMTIPNAPSGGWYSRSLSPSYFSYINLTGVTQFRLRFAKDDNNNLAADYLKFFSGNAATAANRPTLIVKYYVP